VLAAIVLSVVLPTVMKKSEKATKWVVAKEITKYNSADWSAMNSSLPWVIQHYTTENPNLVTFGGPNDGFIAKMKGRKISENQFESPRIIGKFPIRKQKLDLVLNVPLAVGYEIYVNMCSMRCPLEAAIVLLNYYSDAFVPGGKYGISSDKPHVSISYGTKQLNGENICNISKSDLPNFLSLPQCEDGVPSASTYRKVGSEIITEKVHNVFIKYSAEIYDDKIVFIIDGKTQSFYKVEPPEWVYDTEDMIIDMGILIGPEYSIRAGCNSGYMPDKSTNWDLEMILKNVTIYNQVIY